MLYLPYFQALQNPRNIAAMSDFEHIKTDNVKTKAQKKEEEEEEGPPKGELNELRIHCSAYTTTAMPMKLYSG